MSEKDPNDYSNCGDCQFKEVCDREHNCAMDEASVFNARPASEEYLQGRADALNGVIDHWFLQGGKHQFGELDHGCTDETLNEDNIVAAILSVVRKQLPPPL